MSDQSTPKKEKPEKKRGRKYLGKKILRILAAAAGALDTLGDFTYNPYPYLYNSLGHVYDEDTINDAVNDLVDRGLVEKCEGRGVRLASVGADVKLMLYQQRQEMWDGKWRVVFFDIPEARRSIRDDLRAELKKLGFGLWQRSAWITPFDIAEELDSYLRKQNLSGFVQILVGERVGALDNRKFAARVWPILDEVNEKYHSLLNEWKEEIGKESAAEKRLEVAVFLHNRYLSILADDPRLPPELLPDDWVGGEAQKLFKKLKSTLSGGKAF
jgi:DNA-binding transcriptional regulator PaaX